MPDGKLTPCLSARFRNFLGFFVAAGRAIDCGVFDDGKNGDETMYVKYMDGCPFFKDMQREILLIPHGLSADVTGILCFADKADNSFVLCAENGEVKSTTKAKKVESGGANKSHSVVSATGHSTIEYTVKKLNKGKSASNKSLPRRLHQINFCRDTGKDREKCICEILGDYKQVQNQKKREQLLQLQMKIAAVRDALKFNNLFKLKKESK
jgi:hypothetical protein